MINYYLQISIDDDFGYQDTFSGRIRVNPNYIQNISGDHATIDPNLFIGRNFYKPIEELLKLGKPLKDITNNDYRELLSKLGEHKLENYKSLCAKFNKNNPYDLEFSSIEHSDKITRVLFRYANSPINSLYLIEESGVVKIIVSPFTKNYFVITDTEWYYFVRYLTEEISIAEIRDIKINQIFVDKPDKAFNLIRQMKFYLKESSNSFLLSVLSYYDKNGYISDKQFNAVAKVLGW
jgi:hypothetical protein